MRITNKNIQMEKDSRYLKICLVSFPMPTTSLGNLFLHGLIKILEPICEKLYVITSNLPKDRTFSEKIKMQDVKTAMHFRNTIQPRWWSDILQFLKIVIIQIKMCWILIKISKEIDIIIFYVGLSNLFPPLLIAKLLRKEVITLAIGKSPSVLGRIERIIYSLSDQIIVDISVESECLIHQFGLEKYRHKLSFGGSLSVDINSFKIKKKLKDRKNIIGYIGRHSPEKGVMNFAKAIPLILKERNDLEFIIGGGGPLFEKIKDELKKNGSHDKVTLTGWAAREKLPDSFNELKLIIVPSYTETIPNVILEAMACGTPVVAAPAGAIPDFIRDGENGFLMENNSPQCIAQNLIRALDDPRLDEIAQNAYDLINTEYSYEVVVEKYRNVLMKKG